MKRRKLLKELKEAGRVLKRHGSQHDIYENPATGRKAPVPRHSEIADSLCQVIKRQLNLK